MLPNKGLYQHRLYVLNSTQTLSLPSKLESATWEGLYRPNCLPGPQEPFKQDTVGTLHQGQLKKRAGFLVSLTLSSTHTAGGSRHLMIFFPSWPKKSLKCQILWMT